MVTWFLKRTLLALIVALIVWIMYRLLTVEAPKPVKPFYEHLPKPTVYAHRGGAKLWPENTLFAFQKAWELGVDVLEMDVRSTRDGAIVVIHDSTVDRTTNGSGAVREMTLAEIQALDAGYRFTPDGGRTFPYRGRGIRIPTLEEVFDALPRARFNIEVKANDPALVPHLAALIQKKGMEEQVVVGAADQRTANALRAALPEVATFATRDEIRAFWLWQKVRLARAWRPVPDALQVPPTYTVAGWRVAVVSPHFVRAAHGLGLHVAVWTVDDPDEMVRLLDMGVDGIMTDRPDILLQVVRDRGR